MEKAQTGNARKKLRSLAWLSLLIVIAIAFAFVFIPAFLIIPFKAQTARGVAWSYALKSWSPVVTMIAALMSIALTVYLWRGARWFGRVAMIMLLAPVFIFAWFARQNHFEWMFNPLPDAAYERAGEADFVAGSDMVMSVVINGEAAAYPIRQMGYHHIAQDTVGGVPIAATY
jgi:hypothetical protein